jgi:hypothetical protein
MFKSGLGYCLAITMVFGGMTAASASSNFDGSWTVSIRSGLAKCETGGAQLALRVENGKISYSGGDMVVSGHVDDRGNIRVSIRTGGHGASGSGHLSGTKGLGTWRGQKAAIMCSGSWEAQRI